MWREGNPTIYCWWECKLVQPLLRTVWRFLKKLEIELLYDTTIPLLSMCISRANHGLKGCMHLTIYCSTIYNSLNLSGNMETT